MSVTTVLPGGSVTAATPEELASLGILTDQFSLPLEQSTFLVAGEANTGKTSLMAGMPGNLILDWEGKVAFLPKSQRQGVSSINITSYKQFEETVNTLVKKQAGWNGVRHITVDSLCNWEDAAILHLERRFAKPLNAINGGYRAGQRLVGSTMFNQLRSLRDAGFGWTVICHLRRSRVGEGSSAREVLRLNGAPETVDPIHREAVHRLLVRKQVDLRVLTTKKVGTHDIPDKVEQSLRYSLQLKAGCDAEGNLDLTCWQPGSTMDSFLPFDMNLPALNRWAAVSAVLEAARDAASKETAAPEISHEQ